MRTGWTIRRAKTILARNYPKASWPQQARQDISYEAVCL
ncbi:unnamed protein product, partial [marine sediment metagenome]